MLCRMSHEEGQHYVRRLDFLICSMTEDILSQPQLICCNFREIVPICSTTSAPREQICTPQSAFIEPSLSAALRYRLLPSSLRTTRQPLLLILRSRTNTNRSKTIATCTIGNKSSRQNGMSSHFCDTCGCSVSMTPVDQCSAIQLRGWGIIIANSPVFKVLAVDLLNPTPQAEARKHKLKVN